MVPISIRRNEEVLFAELDGEAALLDLEANRYYRLDAVGSVMWKSLVEHEAVEEAVTNLLDHYDVEESRLRRDVGEFIAKLTTAGLVSVDGH